jgi:hypothetical protein
VPVLSKAETEGKLEWSKYKDAGVRHLLRLPALSRFHLLLVEARILSMQQKIFMAQAGE